VGTDLLRQRTRRAADDPTAPSPSNPAEGPDTAATLPGPLLRAWRAILSPAELLLVILLVACWSG